MVFSFYMLDLLDISRADCNRHLTSSVGHNTNEAKKAAAEPARAFSNEFKSLVLSFFDIFAMPF